MKTQRLGLKRQAITTEEAMENLIRAATKLTKEATWWAYRTKIDELRIPLLQLKVAKRQRTAALQDAMRGLERGTIER